jgi:hypothetical protein
MENGLVTAEGNQIVAVEEYDRYITNIPKSMKAIFEIFKHSFMHSFLKFTILC